MVLLVNTKHIAGNCKQIVFLQIPSFNGKSSHLMFPGLGQKSPLWNDFELVIRPSNDNGLILYNGDHNNPNGDFVAVFLSGGFIQFAFDAGDGVTLVRYFYKFCLCHEFCLSDIDCNLGLPLL